MPCTRYGEAVPIDVCHAESQKWLRLRIDDVMLGPDCVCSAATEAVNEAVQASNGTEAAGPQEFDLAMGIYDQVKLCWEDGIW